MQRLARWMVSWRLPLAVFCLAVTLALLPLSQSIKADRSVQTLFAPDDPHLVEYNRTAAEFGGEATVLAVYTDPDVLTGLGMARLRELRDRLAAAPFVKSAVCLADLPHPRDPTLWQDFARALFEGTETAFHEGLHGLADGLRSWRPRSLADWFREASDEQLPGLIADVLGAEIYRDVFLSGDGKTVAVVLQFDRAAMATGEVAESVDRLREICAVVQPSPARLVGAPVMISDVYGYLQDDAHRLQWVSTLTMMVVILLLFRNIRWVVVPMLVVWVATIWTRALMAAADIRLTLIGSMTESLITVIGIATVIHVAVLFQEEAKADRAEGAAVDAMRRTLTRILAAFGWTCVTTAVGFASVAVSRVRPVQEYAFVMASASLFVGAAAFFLIPGGGLLLRGWAPATPKENVADVRLESGLHWIVKFVGTHAFATAGAVLAVMAVAGVGFRWLQVETEFTKNFRADAPILESYQFVEERLGGAGLMEIVFTVDDPKPELLERMRRCERDLRGLTGVTKVTGLVDVIDYAERLLSSQRLLGRPGTQQANYLEPSAEGASLNLGKRLTRAVAETAILRVLRALPEGQARSLAGAFWNPTAHRMRLVLRVQERQAVEGKAVLVAKVTAIVKQHLGPTAEPTGLFVLLVFLIDTLVRDQWWAVATSAGGVVIMASLAFQSIRLGVVAFAPKVVLVFAVIGTMGWLGLKVNVATAMIGSVSMGLVVAFSVPYLSRFQLERSAGVGFYTALARTHGSAGKAMIFANLALMLGFLILGLSRFIPTIHFGLLVSVAILGGVVGNLILLPVLLRLVYWIPAPTDADLAEM